MRDQFFKCKRIFLGLNSSKVQKAPKKFRWRVFTYSVRRNVTKTWNGKINKKNKTKFGNEVADRIRVKVKIFCCCCCFYFPCSFPVSRSLLSNRELKMETFSGRRELQPCVTSWFVQYCPCSYSPHCRRAPVGDVKLVCLELWREREYLTFISIRFVAFSNQNFADYRS